MPLRVLQGSADFCLAGLTDFKVPHELKADPSQNEDEHTLFIPIPPTTKPLVWKTILEQYVAPLAD
jgi:hypothetical protein